MTARFITSAFRGRSYALVALAIAVMVSTTAHATIIYTSNLSSLTDPSPSPNGNQFQLGVNGGSVTGITNTPYMTTIPGYNFIYQSAYMSWFNGASTASSGITISLDMATSTHPDPFDTQDGGYFLALDSVYENSAIDINNIMTITGDTYTVNFDWAGTQQVGYMGTTTDYLTVDLGSSTAQTTSPVTVTVQSFTGWDQSSFTFTALTTGPEVLSFLAGGTPTGANQEPAMTLLDNISVSQNTSGPPPPMTPEPSSLLLLATGLVGLGGFIRYRFKKGETTSL